MLIWCELHKSCHVLTSLYLTIRALPFFRLTLDERAIHLQARAHLLDQHVKYDTQNIVE